MKRWLRKILIGLAVGLLAVGTAACGRPGGGGDGGDGGNGGGGDTLVFATIPSEQQTDPRQSHANLISLLEEETGRTVELKQVTNYNGVIEGMKSGTVDVAGFGPFSYVLATTIGAEVTPVGVPVDSKDAEPAYNSYGIARADDAGVDGIEDFKGKKVCFVDPASTSGYLFPTAGLKEAGIDPATGITPVMAGGHDLSALSVVDGKCDVGFAYDDMVDVELIEAGKLEQGELKVVWESLDIPASPLAMRDALPEDVKAAVTKVVTEQLNVDWLVANGRCENAESCSIGGESGWGYVPVEDSFFDPVREVCNITQSEQCKGDV